VAVVRHIGVVSGGSAVQDFRRALFFHHMMEELGEEMILKFSSFFVINLFAVCAQSLVSTRLH